MQLSLSSGVVLQPHPALAVGLFQPWLELPFAVYPAALWSPPAVQEPIWLVPLLVAAEPASLPVPQGLPASAPLQAGQAAAEQASLPAVELASAHLMAVQAAAGQASLVAAEPASAPLQAVQVAAHLLAVQAVAGQASLVVAELALVLLVSVHLLAVLVAAHLLAVLASVVPAWLVVQASPAELFLLVWEPVPAVRVSLAELSAMGPWSRQGRQQSSLS